jgi:hypothetical protein
VVCIGIVLRFAILPTLLTPTHWFRYCFRFECAGLKNFQPSPPPAGANALQANAEHCRSIVATLAKHAMSDVAARHLLVQLLNSPRSGSSVMSLMVMNSLMRETMRLTSGSMAIAEVLEHLLNGLDAASLPAEQISLASSFSAASHAPTDAAFAALASGLFPIKTMRLAVVLTAIEAVPGEELRELGEEASGWCFCLWMCGQVFMSSQSVARKGPSFSRLAAVGSW